MTDADDGSRSPGKIARFIDEHNMTGLSAELEDRWTAENDQRMSLRDLADYFNRELLQQYSQARTHSRSTARLRTRIEC